MRLFGFERRWLHRILDAVLPSRADEALPLGVSDVPMDGLLDDIVANAPAQMGIGFRGAVWLLTWWGPLLTGRIATFGMLSLDDRAGVLEKLAHHPLYLLREIPMLMKMVACLGYAAMPDVQRAIGVAPDATPPPWATGDPW